MKKCKITAIALVALLLTFAVILNVPGNVSSLAQPAIKIPPMPTASATVKVSFLKTATVDTPEAFAYAQGSIFKNFAMVHGAVLVEHGSDSFLFDTGLGRNADHQFSEDMPFWLKPFMAYKKGLAAVDQLQALNIAPPKRIFLSHAHWDHASAVEDFPQSEIWVTAEEHAYLKTPSSRGAGQAFASQVDSSSIHWHDYSLNNIPYAGFEKSYDLYGDGTVVFVGLFGHSPGSVGLFVNAQDGRRRFLVGDAVWNVQAVKELKRKFWLPSWMLDSDREATATVIAKLNLLMRSNPELKIIPAHDLNAWR